MTGSANAQPIIYSQKTISILSKKRETKFIVSLRSPDFLQSDLISNKQFPKKSGIFIIFKQESLISLPFNNIFSPRDLVFINAQNKVSEILPSVSAETTQEIISTNPAKALLQLNGGATTSYNIKVGDMVNF
jgi:uncharacterized membrane protein (UPF0127 family)